MNLCKCGCGKEIIWKSWHEYRNIQYIYGHQNIGKHRSEEFKKKRSILYTGEGNPFYGKTHSLETIQQQRNIKLGKKLTDEHKKNIGKAMLGMIFSEERNKKISKSLTGKKLSKKHKKKLKTISEDRVERSFGQFANYSRKVCGFFDTLNQKYNLDFQHALNRKEKRIVKSILGTKIRKNYYLDGYSEKLKLNIEIDGKSHLKEKQIEKDKERDKYFSSLGIKVIRIKEFELENYDFDKLFKRNKIK